MGNCIESCMQVQEVGICGEELKEKEEEAGADEKGRRGGNGGGMKKIKLVLTRKELEWLSFHLEEQAAAAETATTTLEDVLREIERLRCSRPGIIEAWKPSLESIMETPEVFEMDR